jgi:hypothetical protein
LPNFSDHVEQAKHNLSFLEFVNQKGTNFLDWQVTTAFYIGVHLINSHLSNHNMQYRKHVDVKNAINPKDAASVGSGSALPENEYLAYTKLQSLSRRSRYLVNEKDDNLKSSQAFKTYEVHCAKALRHLNTLLAFFKKTYGISVDPITITCEGIKQGDLAFAK